MGGSLLTVRVTSVSWDTTKVGEGKGGGGGWGGRGWEVG